MKIQRNAIVKNIELEGVKYIQVLIPDYESNKELLALELSGSGNSYSYASSREVVGHLTVQVNAYVKKDSMELLKAHEQSEQSRKAMRESADQTAALTETVNKLSPLLNNPNLALLLANPALLDQLAALDTKNKAKAK